MKHTTLVACAIVAVCAAANAQIALTGGTIYTSPSEDPIANGVVVIRDGRIAAVGRSGSVRAPRGVPRIDCKGLTIVAGFWNSHVHFGEKNWKEAAMTPRAELAGHIERMLTRYGFTSVFDLGSPLENTKRIRERLESREIPGPRIRTTGDMLLGKGFYPPADFLKSMGWTPVVPPPEVTTAEEALRTSKERLDAGADGLKFYAASAFTPFATLPDDMIRAIVGEAHRRGKPAFAHPQSLDGLKAAVAGGVGVVAHTTPPPGVWDDALIAEMRQKHIAVIPTLKLWTVLLRDRPALRDERTRNNLAQLRAWLAADGVVLFGTDVDAGMEDFDTAGEFALMREAGMTHRQILASLTTAPAEKFGDTARLGRIAPGLVADLVVLNGDPSPDVRAVADVRYTIPDGKIIYLK